MVLKASGPLAAIAAVLLTGHMPKLMGHAPKTYKRVQPATGCERVRDFGVLSSDLTGIVSGVRIARAEEGI